MQRSSAPEIWIAANTTWNLFNFRAQLIHALLDAGYRVTAFSPTDPYVDKVRALGVQHVHFALNNRGTNPLWETVSLLKVATLLRRARPSALLTFTPKPNIYGSIAARWSGVPVIANIAGLGRAFATEGWVNLVSRLLYQFALRHPAKIFFQNSDDLEFFVSAGIALRKRSALLPGSGVDVSRFVPVARRPGPRFTFLFVGRLLAEKGVREFVDASRQLIGRGFAVDCHILGFIEPGNPSSISENELKTWEAEGAIRYLGATDDVSCAMAQADCVVLPSYYKEGCPRSLLEAASMAIPLIAADTSGCRDVVTDGMNGFLCRPRDSSDLAEKMVRMLSMAPAARARMGQAGRERILKEFDEKIVVKRYMDAIRNIGL